MYNRTFSIKNSIHSFNYMHIESHERLRICYVLWLEMTFRELSFKLCIFFPLLTIYNKVENIYAFCLPVYACSNSPALPSNALKLMNVMYVDCRLFCNENGVHSNMILYEKKSEELNQFSERSQNTIFKQKNAYKADIFMCFMSFIHKAH